MNKTKNPLIAIKGQHLAEIKSTGVVHDLLRTGEPSAQKRQEQAHQPAPTLADLWPKK